MIYYEFWYVNKSKKINVNLNYHFKHEILYIKNNSGVCLFVWVVLGRFFQSLPIPYGTGDK
jgi:hypothetical protein